MFYRSLSRGPAFASDENTPKDLIVNWVVFFLVGVYWVLNPDLFPTHINTTHIIIISAVICLLSLCQAAAFMEEDPVLLDVAQA